MDDRLDRYAELAVRVGANVQEGQQVFVHGLVEHAELVRALTRQAYRAGASYVSVLYGVTMGGDGVSQVVSRRLPREEAAAAGAA